MTELQYPIGKFISGQSYSLAQIHEFVNEISVLPSNLNKVCENIGPEDLLKTYREGSWTVKQVIHHIAESHMNAYIRVKLALTEDNPTIKPYDENAWVNTAENFALDHTLSLSLLNAVQLKLSTLLSTLSEEEWDRTFFHPQYKKEFTIKELAALYSWHGRHHLEHIKLALGL